MADDQIVVEERRVVETEILTTMDTADFARQIAVMMRKSYDCRACEMAAVTVEELLRSMDIGKQHEFFQNYKSTLQKLEDAAVEIAEGWMALDGELAGAK